MSDAAHAADLAADTAVHRTGDGRYRIDLSDRWDFRLPSGGVLMTCALRAAAAEVDDPSLRLISASTVFCTPFRPGGLAIEVVVLRRGGSAVQVRVSLRPDEPIPSEPSNDGRGTPDAGLELIATFCRDRKGPDLIGTAPPDVPGPSESVSVIDDHPANPHGRIRFFRNFECRIADGERLWLPGWEPGPAHLARWFRYLRPQRDRDGHLDRLALPPVVDTMPGAVLRALGPSDYRFYAPSLDLTLHVVDDTDREWLLVTTHARRARAGWAIADAEVWDDRGRFLAFATQAMYVSSLAGTPPVVDASARPWRPRRPSGSGAP